MRSLLLPRDRSVTDEGVRVGEVLFQNVLRGHLAFQLQRLEDPVSREILGELAGRRLE